MTSEPVAFARYLRNNAMPEERALWAALSHLRPRFTRQLRIGPYVADLACRGARMIVEVDGGQHNGSRHDERRSAGLEADGWRIFRCWNSDIHDNLDGVVEALMIAGGERLPGARKFEFVSSRTGRERRPRTRKKGPPPAPPENAGGES